MKDNDEKDRELLENLEHILADQDSEVSEQLDEDTRTALDFARKMALLRETPSEEFKDNLKAQLVHQLAEQAKKESSDEQILILWGVPRRRLWQGTIAALIVVIIVAIILLITILLNPAN